MRFLIRQRVTKPDQVPAWRVALIYVLTLVIIGLALSQVVQPVRALLAKRYLSRGDAYMLMQDFDKAAAEYSQAVSLHSTLPEAEGRVRLAKESKTDIAQAREFFASRQLVSVVERIDQATFAYEQPKRAAEVGVQFYAEEAYAYAQYPLERAVSLDPAYAEAWHYLALTYEKLAEKDALYQEKMVRAFAERDRLTTRYLNP